MPRLFKASPAQYVAALPLLGVEIDQSRAWGSWFPAAPIMVGTCDLVFVDTMAQVTLGAIENSCEDMGKLVSDVALVGKALGVGARLRQLSVARHEHQAPCGQRRRVLGVHPIPDQQGQRPISHLGHF